MSDDRILDNLEFCLKWFCKPSHNITAIPHRGESLEPLTGDAPCASKVDFASAKTTHSGTLAPLVTGQLGGAHEPAISSTLGRLEGPILGAAQFAVWNTYSGDSVLDCGK